MANINTQFTDVNMRNYKSATNPAIRPLVEQTIRDEIQQGNYVISATKPTVVSALGAIPKPNSTEVRLIHDCSRPHGHAVNDFISTRSFKFQTLDDAIKLLKPNYFMAKIDLKHAYRSFTLQIIRRRVASGVFRETTSTLISTTLVFHLVLKVPQKSSIA